MEIFIIGAIVVAIMAYVSTKVKRIAGEAYEQENVEAEHFRIIKPESFIIPVKENSEFAFETYSKDYGEDLAEKFHQSWAVVKEKNGIEDDTEVLETERVEENVTLKVFNKTLIDKSLDKSFELEITVLPAYEEKYAEGIKLMLESFCLK
ncbi:MAG: hypothetical protein HC846_08620 [Blastocatellia bacterium]|nr:hypothetical protein [Blastocatellia bacterium]